MQRLALLLALTGLAEANDGDGVQRETLVVGQRVEHDVGYARGVACDDPDVVGAEMATKRDSNVVVFTAKKAGKTLCRAGTDPNRVSYVFEITVRPKPRTTR